VVKPPKMSSPKGRDGCRPKISMNLERFQRPAGPGTKLRVAMMAWVPWKWSVILYLQHNQDPQNRQVISHRAVSVLITLHATADSQRYALRVNSGCMRLTRNP
jgi:hypothetical protein